MRYLILFFTLCIATLNCFAADFYSTKLSNGQTVIIKEIHDNPIVTVDTWIKTGSINENDKNNGVSHFLEHLFFKGTKKYPTGEFDKIIESKGAITNAATSKDYTHYYITTPSKDFDLALSMHADMLLNPAIPQEELDKERKVVIEEIARSNDQPSTKLYENLVSAFYKTHPYKRRVLGTSEIISNITRDEIFEYYNKFYTPSNMVTVVVGDVDTQKTIKNIETLFKSKKAQISPKTVKHIEKLPECPQEIVANADVQNSYVLIGFRTTDVKNKKDIVALDLLATILGDGKTSRLYQNIKEKKKLAYTISAGNSTMKDDGMFFINANYKPEDYPRLKDSILQEIEKLKKYPVSEQELNKAKNMLERDTFYSRESVSNISQELGYIAAVYGDLSFYNGYVPLAKTVTSKQLLDVANKYLDENKMVISVLNPNLKQISNRKISKIEPANRTYKAVKTKGTISEYLLKNNATMLINKNTSNDIVAMQIIAKGGSFIEGTPGVAQLTAAGMLRGSNKYSYEELMNILEENGIKLSTTPGSETFTISIKSTKKELPVVFDVLNEIVNNANFDPQDIDKIKSEKIAAIQKQRDNPMNVAFEEFKTNIWKGTPYGRTGLIYEKTFPTIQQKEIKDFYSKIFNPQNIVISINGNVEAKDVGGYFENIFQNKNGEKIQISDLKPVIEPLKGNETIKKNKKTEAAWLVLGWKTSGLDNLKDYAALEVIDSLLGTGMSSRMFRKLRDTQGLAYQTGSSYGANSTGGVFALFIGTNPCNISVAKNGMLKEIDILKKEFVSEEELKKTKEKILGNYILSMETNMEKAGTIGSYAATLNDWDFYNKYTQLIENVTVQDIIRVMNKYFEAPYLYVEVSEK